MLENALLRVKQSGRTIGLGISRSIVEAHQRQLWAAHKPAFVVASMPALGKYSADQVGLRQIKHFIATVAKHRVQQIQAKTSGLLDGDRWRH